jgi:sugar/nucleoside kinase (ribokinase family)
MLWEGLVMIDVGCAGILVADTFCGPMKRIPSEGELLLIEQMPSKAGGCAANVAIDLAKQGFMTEACGCVGTDSSAEVLLGSLRTAGVGCEPIQRLESHPTSKTVILLVEGQDRRYIHLFGANAAFQVQQIRRNWIDRLKVFYLGGLFLLPAIRADEMAELLKYCRQRGIVTVVDVVVPQGYSGMESLQPLLPHIDYFLPNDDEAQRLTGFPDTDHQLESFLQRGAGTVVITCGHKGSQAACGGKRWQADAYQVPSIDPSGAGDAFAAGVVCGILRHWDLSRTLSYAAALGASATTAVGTTDGVFNRTQAESFIAANLLDIRCSGA